MSKIIYPSIYLFVYQLGFGLGASKDTIEASAAKFLANFPPEYQEKAAERMKSLATPQSDVVFFCDRPKDEFPLPDSEKLQFEPYALDGLYDPARLGDSYGLLLDASVEEKDREKILKPQPISCFRTILEPFIAGKSGNLGKTCILYGYLPPGADAEALAKSIYQEFAHKQFSPEEQLSQEETKLKLSKEEFLERAWRLNEKQRSRFLGADLFAAWHIPRIGEKLPEYLGVYIILYPDPEPELEVLSLATEFHEKWLRLFWFQNKILWACDRGRELKQRLKENFEDINYTFQEIERTKGLKGGDLDLQHLQRVLKNKSKTIANYAVHLSLLEMQQSTLETNLYNYRLCLEDLEEAARKIAPTDLGVFREFADIAEGRYQRQLQKDYASLKPGLDALENLVNPLSSIVEIEQAQRDRDFQANVETWGFGLAAAAIVGTTLSPFVPTILHNENRDSPPTIPAIEGGAHFIFTTVVSIVAGIVAKFFAPYLLRLGKK